MGADEYLERLEAKIRKSLFFYVKIFSKNSVLPKHQVNILCRSRPQLKRKRLEEDDMNQGYRNRYNLINSEHKRRKTVWRFERKVPDKTTATIMLHQEAFQLCGKIY